MWRSPSPSGLLRLRSGCRGSSRRSRPGLPVRFVADHRPYRERKVRILNGGHTVLTPAALLSGHTLVRTCMADRGLRNFLDGALFQEIIPTLSLPRAECEDFARAVEERFDNPYVDHRLVDIALNSVSKWRARVLPSVEAFHRRQGALPLRLVFSFAALCALYSRGEGEGCPVRDEPAVLDFFARRQADGPEALVAALCRQGGLLGPGSDGTARLRPRRGAGHGPHPGRWHGRGAGGLREGGAEMSRCLRIAPTDNVAVALEPVAAGIRVAVEGASVTTREDIPQGHKLALTAIPAGADVIKYGYPIGRARTEIQPGQWVHTHNLATRAGWGGRPPGSGGGWGPGPPAASLLSGLPPGGRPGGNPQRALDRAHRGLR